MMLMSWNSALRVKTVVNEPAPATSGNAIGTMEADSGFDVLLISMPKIISTAMIKLQTLLQQQRILHLFQPNLESLFRKTKMIS